MKKLLLIPIFFAAATASHAVLLVQYAFNGASPAPTFTGANVSAGNFFVSNGAISGTTDAAYILTTNTASTTAGALDGAAYFEMTLSAAPGFLLNLDSVVFDYGSYRNAGSNFTYDVYLQSNPTGFGSALPVVFTTSGTAVSGTSMHPDESVSLLSSTYQGISAITFRWTYSDPFNSTNANVRLDNVRVNGTAVPLAAIPEPSQIIGVVGLAGLGIFLFIRRRRSAKAAA